MQETFIRLFWDGKPESFSEEFKVKRLLEYGSFPDIVKYPFEKMQQSLKTVNIDLLRTSESRNKMLVLLKPYLIDMDSWESALKRYIRECLSFDEEVIK